MPVTPPGPGQLQETGVLGPVGTGLGLHAGRPIGRRLLAGLPAGTEVAVTYDANGRVLRVEAVHAPGPQEPDPAQPRPATGVPGAADTMAGSTEQTHPQESPPAIPAPAAPPGPTPPAALAVAPLVPPPPVPVATEETTPSSPQDPPAGPTTPPPTEALPAPADAAPTHFINPYNFVPFGSRADADGNPPRHDRYQPGRYNGQIPITITVATPLLVPDQSVADGTEADPYPVRVGLDGAAMLAATSVKGMLRSAFEAVTCSRMGVFGGQDMLAMREPVTAAPGKLPALVVERNGRLLLQTTEAISFAPQGTPTQLPVVRNGVARDVDPLPVVLVPEQQVQQFDDRQEVEAWAALVRHGPEQQYWAWRTALVRPARSLPATPPAVADMATSRSYSIDASPARQAWIHVRGVLLKTGRTFASKTKSKHDEHLVVTDIVAGPAQHVPRQPSIPIDETVERMWAAVLDGYRRAERDHVPLPVGIHARGPYARRTPDAVRAWSLTPGRTCFIELDDDGTLVGVSPVMIGRAPFPAAPRDLVPPSMLPAERLDQLSSADRVFGWAAERGAAVSPSAYRGNLSVEPCQALPGPGATTVRALHPPVRLAALQSPKPSQFRFYAALADGRPLPDGLPKRVDSGYRDTGADATGRTLRGRKVYPHHVRASQFWDWPRPGGEQAPPDWLASDGSHDTQTSWIRGWVPPGTVFTTTVHVQNLSAAELGALLWLVTLGKGYFHRLGMGKPLGFGSVHVACDLAAVEVSTGEQLAAGYLDATPPKTVDPHDLEVMARPGHFAGWPGGPGFAAQWLSAARGFPGPIHYPRVTPAPQPEGYPWFVGNEYLNRQVGARVLDGRRLSLPALPQLPQSPTDDMPLLPYEPWR